MTDAKLTKDERVKVFAVLEEAIDAISKYPNYHGDKDAAEWATYARVTKEVCHSLRGQVAWILNRMSDDSPLGK